MQGNGVLCVNTLGASSEYVADVFAGRVNLPDRFAVGDWTALRTGSPVLASAVVAFDCRVIDVRAVATHNVFIASVEALHFGAGQPALMYHERSYKRF